MKKIVFTGGGTAGHVTLNTLLIPHFLKEKYSVFYIGSIDGIEKEIISENINVQYFGIETGKYRRYLTLKNFKDIFKVVKGFFQARKILRELRPNLVFSKGGFVSVPVVLAAKTLKIRVLIHESDLSLGMANKIGYQCCDEAFSTFPLNLKKSTRVGSLISSSDSKKDKLGTRFTLDKNKKTVLFIGGSQGAAIFNRFVLENQSSLRIKYNVVLISGPGNTECYEDSLICIPYVKKGLGELFELADYVVTRGGSNTIFELLAKGKKMIIVPLNAESSRGDQIENAKYFEDQGYSVTLSESDLTKEQLDKKIDELDARIEPIDSSNEFMEIEDFYTTILKNKI